MTRNWMNWTYDDVVHFLEQHYFVWVHTRGSHRYYQGLINGSVRLVEVQYHAGEALKPRTLKTQHCAQVGDTG